MTTTRTGQDLDDAGLWPEPTWDRCEVLANAPAGDRYHRMTLRAPTIAARARAGQFVMITVPASEGTGVLPRPMAIHRRRRGVIDVLYGVKGAGTRAMAALRPGARVVTTGPLGRGFRLKPGTSRVLLLGRGIGVCSVMGVAEDAAGHGVSVSAVLSARVPEAVIGREDLRELGLAEPMAVTDVEATSDMATLRRRLAAGDPAEQIMVCGSERLTRLARELAGAWGASAQVSVEAHMACGLGYCHGCASAPATNGEESPLVCVDGPVFDLDPAPV